VHLVQVLDGSRKGQAEAMSGEGGILPSGKVRLPAVLARRAARLPPVRLLWCLLWSILVVLEVLLVWLVMA